MSNDSQLLKNKITANGQNNLNNIFQLPHSPKKPNELSTQGITNMVMSSPSLNQIKMVAASSESFEAV